MKAKDKVRLSVLRMILSEIKYAQASVNAQDKLPDAEVVKIAGTYHKRLTKSLADFPGGEKKQEIQNEIDIVGEYLPKKATPEEVEAAIDQIISTTDDKNFGVLMKAVLANLGSAADGKLVSQLLKKKL
jgi:hypothetical protein